MKYTLSQIASISGGRLTGIDRTVENIAIDSRNHAAKESLFVAISGKNHDGHEYVREMSQRGVTSFMVERIPDGVCGSFVLVDNSLRALQALSSYHRASYSGELVAITGSNGKTVVKEWFAQLWDENNGKLLRSPRSYNSQLGVALSLLMIEGDERLVFIEAGISESGEMERLEQMIRPTLGVLTNIGDAHLLNFVSADELRSEKMKLFCHLKRVVFADEKIKDVDDRNRDLVLRIYTELALGHKELSELQPIAMRLELKEGVHGSTIINDSYINDLASLTIALDYQNRLQNQRKVLIFSDFPGSYSAVADLVSKHEIDLFVGIGELLSNHKDKFAEGSLFYRTTEEFLQNFDLRLIAGCSVLLKGSRLAVFERIDALLENKTHTTVLEVDLDAMAANLNHYRAMLRKGCRTMAMVKAHSYGSGSIEIATMLQHQGADYLAVAFADEGITLRRAGIHMPIVVLNPDPHSFRSMVEYRLEPEIYSFSSLDSFICTVKSCGVSHYPIHLKMDTGMHRLGFADGEIDELNRIINSQHSVKAASIFSHFAVADDTTQDAFTRSQIELFRKMASRLPKAVWHICNTSGIERFPEAHFDMVRLGIGLYTGYQIASRLKTQIVQIKTVPSGDTIGYGRYGRPTSDMPMAIIPIGYADGLDRRLSRGVGKVSIAGHLCPIIGNICMDTCMVDLSEVPDAKEGDEVILFGDSPTIEQIAQWLDTISYEILTSVSSRIKRIYING